MSTSTMKGSYSTEQTVNVTTGQAFKEEHSFKWKIENFLAINSSPDLINAQKFSFTAGKSHGYFTNWYCELKEKTDTNTIALFLCLEKAPFNIKPMVDYSFRILEQNGKTLKTNGAKRKVFSQNLKSSRGFSKFIPRDEETLNKLICEDGSIVIQVNVELLIFQPIETQNDISLEKRELQKLSQSMTRLIKLESQPEVAKIIKVVSKDKVEFYANTATLGCRSPVFKAMFDSGNWKEGQGSSTELDEEKSLVLEEISGKTLNVLLHYLIGGVLLKDVWKADDVILELTWAAPKYQLEGLTEFLDKVLPAIIYDTEITAKLALLTKRLGMKNAEKGLLSKLKQTVTDIDQLVLDKSGSLLERD